MFGSGEYEYAFYLGSELIRDYSEDNTYTFKTLPEHRDEKYILTVKVKDSTGNTASDKLTFFVGQ